MTGEWLAFARPVPSLIASVFNRAGIPYEIVSGYLQEEYVWKQINGWIDAARVINGMKNNRMGILVNDYYCGMLDVYTDLTRQSSVFGTHVEIVEMCELKAYRDNVTDEDIKRQTG